MVDIPLLEPAVLQEVVQFLVTPENLTLSSMLNRVSTPVRYYTWDLLRGSRTVAKPNVPNSEAHIVPRLGRGQRTAALAYTREKKVFEPTTTMWLRELGSVSNVQRAEEAILREVTELNTRVDNYVEWACWQAIQGTLEFPGPDVVAPAIDYGIASSHKIVAGTSWATATPQQLVEMIRVWKRLVERDARVPATDAFCTEVTIARIFDAFASGGNAAGNPAGAILSDNMKDQYYRTGTLPGFMGLNWHTVEGQYDDDSGNTALFLADDALVIANLSSGEPMKIVEGPSADFSAPQGHIGKFTKTWEEPDPSGKQVLMEYSFLPIITRPDQLIVVPDVTFS